MAFLIQVNASQVSVVFDARKKELRNAVARITREYGKIMTREAKQLLPQHWLLTRDLAPTYQFRSKRIRHVAGVSFKTKGIRDRNRPSRAVNPKKGHEFLLKLNTPRVYAIHHDRGNGNHHTEPTYFLTSPLRRNSDAYVNAIANAVRELCDE